MRFLLFFVTVLLISASALAQGLYYTQEVPFILPEITQDPERSNCALYTNRFQQTIGDEEVWESPHGPVVFKFYRGDAREPDQVMVWDMPKGYSVIPNTHYLEEEESDYFCIEPFLGS